VRGMRKYGKRAVLHTYRCTEIVLSILVSLPQRLLGSQTVRWKWAELCESRIDGAQNLGVRVIQSQRRLATLLHVPLIRERGVSVSPLETIR